MKKIISLTVAALLAISLFTACDNPKETDQNSKNTTTTTTQGSETLPTSEEVSAPKTEAPSSDEITTAYEELVIRIRDDMYAVTRDASAVSTIEGFMGFYELAFNEGYGGVRHNVGYLIKDVNFDSIPELLFFENNASTTINAKGTRIIAAYTYAENEPRLIFAGGGRSRYYMLSDNTFYNEGSGGAAYSQFGTFELEKNSTELSYLCYYFTEPDTSDMSKINFYTNTSGISDSSLSSVCSENTFQTTMKNMAGKITEFDITCLPA